MKLFGVSPLASSTYSNAGSEDNHQLNDGLEFKDLNFKLAVIEVLMYEKKIIKPAVDAFEFAKNYSYRKIDIDEEGYQIIPEILEYFDNLKIQASQAELVEEIYQDGGNNIYMTISPFWDGEDDSFNINSAEDVALLPNLKKVTLFGGDGSLAREFRSKGVEVDWL